MNSKCHLVGVGNVFTDGIVELLDQFGEVLLLSVAGSAQAVVGDAVQSRSFRLLHNATEGAGLLDLVVAELQVAQIHLLGRDALQALAQQAGEAGEGLQARVVELHQLGDVLIHAHELAQALAEYHQLIARLAVFRALNVGILHVLLVALVMCLFPSLLPLVDGVI
ncbi:hypothetical protein D3C76_781160 [compost metagenome]